MVTTQVHRDEKYLQVYPPKNECKEKGGKNGIENNRLTYYMRHLHYNSIIQVFWAVDKKIGVQIRTRHNIKHT